MALLLFPHVRPLTCRSAALLHVVRTTLPVQTLCTGAQSHITLKPAAINGPSDFNLTTHRILSISEQMVSVRSCRSRWFSSQRSDENPFVSNRDSNLHANETDGKDTLSVSDGQTNSMFVSDVNTDSTRVHDMHTDTGSISVPGSHTDTTSESDVHMEQTTSVPRPIEEEGDFQELAPPRPMEPSFTLTPYVAQSQVLQKLVALGMDLSAVEKVTEAANALVQADWLADIQPRLLFLRDVGVDDAKLGRVLSKNPLLLKEAIENMQERIGYLQTKKFSQEQIAHIVTSAPLTLLLPVTYIDKKLGFLQKTFNLTGDEVRQIATRLPKLIPWKLQKLKDLRFYMKDMLGFSDSELKTMLLAVPRVFISDRHQLGKRFDFLHNMMGLSHKHLTAWPSVFRTRLHIMEQRHRFLLLLDRAQYDPTKENYVSLKALVSGRDGEFCEHVAKASSAQFYSFLKSL